MHRWIIILLVLGWLAAGTASLAGAAETEGVEFKNKILVNEKILKLQGTALLKHLVVIKAYVGAFYLPKAVSAQKALRDIPKALILHYFHAIPAADFANATTAMIKKNVSDAAFKALKPRIKQMNSLYRDITPGDEYQATYIPGTGTSLALNGKKLGVVPGPKFAFAYFSIWLGEKPISKSFRDRLLDR